MNIHATSQLAISTTRSEGFKSTGMRNHKEDSQNRNDCLARRQKKYDREMDHAFTLIFHNIKRLQDGRVCNNVSSSLEEVDIQPEAMAFLKAVPLHSTLSKSDPSLNGLTEHHIAQHGERPDTRAKFGSFSGIDASPTQRRKVRFADDYATNDTKLKTRPPLRKRPWSDLPAPVIVVTKEH